MKILVKLRRTATLILMIILVSPVLFAAQWAWNIMPPAADYDVRWQQVDKLWQQHWEGEHLDEIIELTEEIFEDHPGRPEAAIWLARACTVRAAYEKREERREDYEKAEKYALKALKIDPDNVCAFKALVDTLPYLGDKEQALNKYGSYFEKFAPLTPGYVIPTMDYPEWEQARKHWDNRSNDVEQAKKAAIIFEQLADSHPKDILALSWALRANYDIGQYYTAVDGNNSQAMAYYEKAMGYARKAFEIDRYYVPANYWYELALARSVQFESLLGKAKHLRPLVHHGRFTLRENGLYNYFGPALALATMITNGGWVTEKGMQIIGIRLEEVMTQLDLAEILYPGKFYILYGKADVLAYKGRTDEALVLIEQILKSDPDANPYVALENRAVVEFSKRLRDQIKK